MFKGHLTKKILYHCFHWFMCPWYPNINSRLSVIIKMFIGIFRANAWWNSKCRYTFLLYPCQGQEICYKCLAISNLRKFSLNLMAVDCIIKLVESLYQKSIWTYNLIYSAFYPLKIEVTEQYKDSNISLNIQYFQRLGCKKCSGWTFLL